MEIEEAIKALKTGLSPEIYERHKKELDEIGFQIGVEDQDLHVRTQEQAHG